MAKSKAKKSILNAAAKRFMKTYLNTPSPTGYECAGQKVWLEYLKPYIDDYIIDNYGTVVGIVNPEAEYKVVIEAHADEISWFVHHITDDGFIYVIRNGGSDAMCAPSKRVNIHLKNGEIVKAVFGWKAIHLRGGGAKNQNPTVENIFLDCGCTSKEEVEEMGIHVGCIVTYEDEFMELNDRYYVGRALDNRMGGFMITQVARMLHEKKVKLPFGLYIVNSVQEEVGLRGAHMIAKQLQADVAIVTDVAHDTTTPMINKLKEGIYKAGDGPILSYAPAVHNKLLDLIFEAAEEEKIPFQRESVSRSTGTDTDAFANQGTVSALISLPLRYMHTTVEMVSKSDVEEVIKLIYASLLKIEDNHDFRYFT